MKNLSIVIPVYNDSSNVDVVLESISKCDFSGLDYEIIVSDGHSSDGLDSVIDKWLKVLPLKYLKNAKGSASVNLNSAIRNSSGLVTCRIDSHVLLDKMYFLNGYRHLIENKDKYSAFGPMVKIIPSRIGRIPKVISKIYSSPISMGPSKFKINYFNKYYDGEVGNIYLGFYWREDLLGINGFNESLIKRQDIDCLNRLVKFTKRPLYLSSDIICTYILKQDQFFTINKRSFRQGESLFKDMTYSSLRLQHLLPILFFFSLFTMLYINYQLIFFFISFLYLSVVIYFLSKELSNVLDLLLSIPICFSIHLSYFTGNVFGLLRRFFA